MITLIFEFMGEKVMVTINGNDIKFGSTREGARMADISGIKLSYAGCCREWGDLELRDDWREEAIRRFKDKIATLNTDMEKARFIIEDLRGHGYLPRLMQRQGYRMEAIA